MQAFERHPPDIVKSVQQRWLLMLWSRTRNGGRLPLSASFVLGQLDPCRDDLSIMDVLAENGGYRFRIFDHGRNVGAMFAGQCAGKYLEETLPEAARLPTLATYEHVVRCGAPVYTVTNTADAEGRPVLYERLLLPLGDNNDRVVRILALLETISTEGTIVRKSLMTSERRAARSFALRAELSVL